MRNALESRAGLALAVLLAFLSTGCALSHVRFTGEGGNPPFATAEHTYPGDGFRDPLEPHVFRVALDRRGDLYPDPREIRFDDALLERRGNSIREYYDEVLKTPYDADAVARDLAAKLETGTRNRPVVVLIHGIGNTYETARRSYFLARMMIERNYGRGQMAFLEVYWDGLVGDPSAVWGHAQSTSLHAGMGLRRILNRLGNGTKIRILSHSRGAAVAASALWNFPMSDKAAFVEDYRREQATSPSPDHLEIRVGMIAPAMGADAFEAYFDRTPGRGEARIHDRMILGINNDDPAVSKEGLPSWMFGSTELGCNLDLFGSRVKPVLGDAAHMVDFSATAVHDFKDYLLRRPFEEKFLPGLLGSPRRIAPLTRTAIQ